MLRDSKPRFVGPSVRPLVRHTLLFFGFCGLWPHRSCPNDLVTLNTAPAHPHATGAAVYPALFMLTLQLQDDEVFTSLSAALPYKNLPVKKEKKLDKLFTTLNTI